MTHLLGVRTVAVPKALAIEAYDHLRKVGRQGLEGFALWAGTIDGEITRVTHTIIPAQQGRRSATGVSVSVGPDELHRINVWAYEHQVRLIAQIHSHPTDAYHSDTDDAYAVVTTAGSLSLVFPDFASRPFSLDDCAVYQLTPEGRWSMLSVVEVLKLIKITE